MTMLQTAGACLIALPFVLMTVYMYIEAGIGAVAFVWGLTIALVATVSLGALMIAGGVR